MADNQISETAQQVKTMISGTTDEKLAVIETLTRQRLARLLHLTDTAQIPDSFNDIVQDVMLKRFNRIGNEGYKSYSEAGEALTFPDSDFDEYQNEIDDYLNTTGNGKEQHARFYIYWDTNIVRYSSRTPTRKNTKARLTQQISHKWAPTKLFRFSGTQSGAHISWELAKVCQWLRDISKLTESWTLKSVKQFSTATQRQSIAWNTWGGYELRVWRLGRIRTEAGRDEEPWSREAMCC